MFYKYLWHVWRHLWVQYTFHIAHFWPKTGYFLIIFDFCSYLLVLGCKPCFLSFQNAVRTRLWPYDTFWVFRLHLEGLLSSHPCHSPCQSDQSGTAGTRGWFCVRTEHPGTVWSWDCKWWPFFTSLRFLKYVGDIFRTQKADFHRATHRASQIEWHGWHLRLVLYAGRTSQILCGS